MQHRWLPMPTLKPRPATHNRDCATARQSGRHSVRAQPRARQRDRHPDLRPVWDQGALGRIRTGAADCAPPISSPTASTARSDARPPQVKHVIPSPAGSSSRRTRASRSTHRSRTSDTMLRRSPHSSTRSTASGRPSDGCWRSTTPDPDGRSAPVSASGPDASAGTADDALLPAGWKQPIIYPLAIRYHRIRRRFMRLRRP